MWGKLTGVMLTVLLLLPLASAGAMSLSDVTPSNPKPQLTICEPEEIEEGKIKTYLKYEEIFFEADAYDSTQDEWLEGEQLVWTDGKGKELGKGSLIYFDANVLGIGTHQITLTATNSVGLIATKTFTVIIEDEEPPADYFRPFDEESLPVVSMNKQWHVTFNQSIFLNSVNTNNIYVTDFETEDIWPVDLSLDSTGKTIIVKPVKDYVQDKVYTLWIRDVQSIEKQIQNVRTYLDFTVN